VGASLLAGAEEQFGAALLGLSLDGDLVALTHRSALPTPESKRKYSHWLVKRSRQLAGRV
jgi:hypothetical protein